MIGRVIIVHSLDHARAALGAARELGAPVTLATAPAASAYLGPAWLPEVAALAAEAVPDVDCSLLLDCGDRAGDVMAALRAGVSQVVFDGPEAVAAKLDAIAEDCGGRLLRVRPPSLDLMARDDALEACRDWLRGGPS
ncbi:MAG: class II fructose-bisphosphate aldolase [Kiloniellales bacterium]|nr:class II fructose-bisphosphate aldolase [Kiloniellales bacterium]